MLSFLKDAMAHNAPVATRNTRDFEGCGIELIKDNPDRGSAETSAPRITTATRCWNAAISAAASATTPSGWRRCSRCIGR
jgi:hypothetical protein